MKTLLSIIGRNQELFRCDVDGRESSLREIISKSSFLVIGAAGSIGQAVTKEIFKRNPVKLHAVDINENNLVELVRDIRSSFGYIAGDFKTFALDIGSLEYDAFINSDGNYDYVLNLSALKHVRSEKDPFTLMRMIDVNIFNTEKTIKQSILKGVKKYFCVSTDKAANPVNMMGASKRIMEKYLARYSNEITISTARFANVAFSDGSLLHGFNQRIQKRQPVVAPSDIRRYFVMPQEAGELCLMSCIFGENKEIFFPKLDENFHLITFSNIAKRFLAGLGYEAVLCKTEDEARALVETLPDQGKWPCLFSESDTTGEKDFEEFYTSTEQVDFSKFSGIGIVKLNSNDDQKLLELFENELIKIKNSMQWDKDDIVELFNKVIPEFKHKDTGKYLDGKM